MTHIKGERLLWEILPRSTLTPTQPYPCLSTVIRADSTWSNEAYWLSLSPSGTETIRGLVPLGSTAHWHGHEEIETPEFFVWGKQVAGLEGRWKSISSDCVPNRWAVLASDGCLSSRSIRLTAENRSKVIAIYITMSRFRTPVIKFDVLYSSPGFELRCDCSRLCGNSHIKSLRTAAFCIYLYYKSLVTTSEQRHGDLLNYVRD